MTTSMQSQAREDAPGQGPGLDSGAPVEVSHEYRQPVAEVWSTLVSPRGSAVWLGEGAVLGDKGDPYHCADGTSGVVRSYHPLEQLRVSWHATEAAPVTVVELDLEPRGDGTLLRLRHDGPVDEARRSQLPQQWAHSLDALETLLGT
jgi:uncharacterized protein YndB with AHSA1/START domain